MVTFVNQALPRFPGNADVANALVASGESIASGIQQRRNRNALTRISDLAASGAGVNELARAQIESGIPALQQAGVNALIRDKESQAARSERATERAAAAGRFEREIGLRERTVASQERIASARVDKLEREKQVQDFFLQQFVGRPGGETATTTIDRADVSPTTRSAAKGLIIAGDFKGAAKLLADAEQAGPRAVSAQAEAKEAGKQTAKVRAKISENAQSARKRLSTFTNLEQANERATTGAFSSQRLSAGRFLNALGMDPGTFGINPDVPATEFMQSQQLGIVLDFISQTKGAISEREMDTFAAAAPGLTNTRVGNRLIIQAGKVIAQREIEIAKRVSRLGIGDFNDAVREQIASEVQQQIPMPNFAQPVQDVGEGGQRTQTARERAAALEAEFERRRAPAGAAIGF